MRHNLYEFECEFVGSVDTINPSKLRNLSHDTPIVSNAGFDMYKRAEKGKDYVITVDVARGTVRDYSAFCVFDVSQNIRWLQNLEIMKSNLYCFSYN